MTLHLAMILAAALAATPTTTSPPSTTTLLGTSHAAPSHTTARPAKPRPRMQRVAELELGETLADGSVRARKILVSMLGGRAVNAAVHEPHVDTEVSLWSDFDDGRRAELNVELKHVRRDKEESWQGHMASMRRLVIGKRTLMISVDGEGRRKLQVWITLR